MKILMITNFITFPFEGGNSRFIYILNSINYKKCDVELITSNFHHSKKGIRDVHNKEINKYPYKVTFIDEPGYRKNVSLKRFYSHFRLARNISKYLKTLKYKPDVIYCSVPSLSVSRVGAKFAKKMGIKFIIDIQDLWPEAFKMVFHVPIISNILFFPMKKEADSIYSKADEIIAVSETYANRGLSVNKKVKKGHCVFLGTNLEKFEQYKRDNIIEFNDEKIRIAYIGTLGHSYDLKCIIDAIKILNDKNVNNIHFLVMGDGPLKSEFENYAKMKGIDYEFTGRLEYAKMVGLLCSCDIAVNPISHGAAQSIINKVGDYASAGLPVVSTQECPEYRDLLSKYNAGLNCKNGDIEDIAMNIEKLIVDEELRKKMGDNNRKLAEEKFDRRKTYDEIIKVISKK